MFQALAFLSLSLPVRVDAHTITASLEDKDCVEGQRARAKRLHPQRVPSFTLNPFLVSAVVQTKTFILCHTT